MTRIRQIAAGDTDLSDNSIEGTDSLVFQRGNQVFTNADLSGIASGGGGSFRLADIKFGREFSGTFPADAPLICGLSGVILDRGTGTRYVTASSDGNGSPADTIDDIRSLGGADWILGSGTFTRFDARGGSHIASASALLDTWNALQGSTSILRYNSSDNAISTLRGNRAVIISERDLDGSVTHVLSNCYAKFHRENPSGTLDTSPPDFPTITNGTLVLINSTLDWEGGNISNIVALGNSRVNFANALVDLTVSSLIIEDISKAQSVLEAAQEDVVVTISAETVLGGSAAIDYPFSVGLPPGANT